MAFWFIIISIKGILYQKSLQILLVAVKNFLFFSSHQLLFSNYNKYFSNRMGEDTSLQPIWTTGYKSKYEYIQCTRLLATYI